jgi:hypothetical protein
VVNHGSTRDSIEKFQFSAKDKQLTHLQTYIDPAIHFVNVRILYLFCNVKKSKTTAKLSKRAESSFVLFVFDGVDPAIHL